MLITSRAAETKKVWKSGRCFRGNHTCSWAINQLQVK